MSKRHAEIVGAGFAGLTAACALAQRGWSVRVHERADRLRTTGAGIYIYENGLRVLEAVGAIEDAIAGAPMATATELIRLHETLLFLRAYPLSERVARLADGILFSFAERFPPDADPDPYEAPEVSGIAGCCS